MVVQQISKRRQSVPSLEAIYFLTPTRQSVSECHFPVNCFYTAFMYMKANCLSLVHVQYSHVVLFSLFTVSYFSSVGVSDRRLLLVSHVQEGACVLH